MHNSKIIKQIAAAIIEHDGKILIAKRGKKDSLENKWEFPGGKVEPGETLEQCLKRELFEELGIEVVVGEYVITSPFVHQDTPYEMCVFKVPSFTGTIELREHKEIRWVMPHELPQFDYPEPDIPIVNLLAGTS